MIADKGHIFHGTWLLFPHRLTPLDRVIRSFDKVNKGYNHHNGHDKQGNTKWSIFAPIRLLHSQAAILHSILNPIEWDHPGMSSKTRKGGVGWIGVRVAHGDMVVEKCDDDLFVERRLIKDCASIETFRVTAVVGVSTFQEL